MTSSPSTVEFIVDQQIRQIQNVQALQPINGPQVVGVDGSRTPPQISTMVSPMDGELPRPSTVGADFYRKAREIRRDPTIRMVRELSMAPLLMAEWEYDAADDAPAGAKDLVESIMTQMRLPLLRTSLAGMIDYGWQPYEVIAEQRDDGVSAPRLKPLLQDLTHILVNAADGSYFGLRQTPTVGTRIGWVYLLDQQSLVISQDVEGTNWYGEPTLRSLEKTYDEAEVVNKSSRKYDQKIAGTHWVIYYPLGTSDYGGKTLDNGEIARKLLQQAEAVGGIAVPRSVINMLDSMNAAAAANEASQWKIELLSDSGKGQQPFTDRQKYLDVLKVRAFGFPERSILEGQFGTKAEAEAHADIAVSNLEVRHALVCLQYSLKIVDLILAWNYGPQAKGKVWIKPSPIADDKKGFFRQLYLALIANPQGFMTEMSAVDLTQLRDRLGLPEFAMPAGASDPWASMIDPVTGQLLMPPSTTTPDPAALPGSPAGFALDHTSSNGRWVTNEDGVHIFINSDGEVRRPSGKESSKKKADDSAKSDVLKRHAAIQDAAAKKRNAKFASLPGNDEHRKAQEQGQKSDGSVAYNTPTEKALTSGNFQYRGLITVGADAEGRLREFATYERPGIPGSILVRPDGAWQHFDGNGYGVAGTSEVDMAAFIKHMSRPGVSMSFDPSQPRDGHGRWWASGSRDEQVKSKEFKKWFGDSKVVDDKGRPLIVYHGSTASFKAFGGERSGKTGNPNAQLGHFFTANAKEASRYATDWGSKGGNVRAVYLSIKNPYVMKYKEFDDLAMAAYRSMASDPDYDPNRSIKWNDRDGAKAAAAMTKKHEAIAREQAAKRRRELEAEGYDGIVVRVGAGDEYIAFHPRQVKSATGNRGSFSTEDDDITLSLADEIDAAADRAKKPTDAQREAGNYRKGHVTIHGLRIAIETPRGEKRKKKWPKLPAHYGYFKGSVGADGDQVDVFVGPKPGTEVAFVANMKGDDGRFDEHKVLIGFKSIDKAKACLAEAYGDDLKRIGKLTPMTIPTLKEWLSRPATVALSYNPDQPRAAAGSRDGGRWTKVTAVAKRFGIPAQTVHDILTTPADELARRDKYMAPSSGRDDAVGPTLDYEKHPLGTAKIDSSRHATGETDNAYVDYLREFDPHELKTSEHEDGISKSGSVAKYVEWAKAGHQAPPISVFDSSNGNGDLVSTNRRRVLAAREAGTKLVGWHGVNNKETGLPLRYGDVKKAAAEVGIESGGGRSTNWEKAPAVSYHDKDDEFLYHVTTAPEKVIAEGLKPRGGKPSMARGAYRDYSRGKVFLTERSKVKWWEDRIQEHLEHEHDDPPATHIVRIPKSKVSGLTADQLGNSDGRYDGSYYHTETVK